MTDDRPDQPFLPTYLIALALQFPLWMTGGAVWAVFMVVLAGSSPAGAVVGGLFWGLSMWLLMGNLVAVGLAWRRTAELDAPDWTAARAAALRAADKCRLAMLAESPGRLVLGPRRALVRFRTQEIRVTDADGAAVLSAPALSFGTIRKAIQKSLDEAAGR